jgi:hypothetical protein
MAADGHWPGRAGASLVTDLASVDGEGADAGVAGRPGAVTVER